MSSENGTDEAWAIVELMGHRRYGARVSTVEQFGAKWLGAEVVRADGTVAARQLVHTQAVYCITLCTEAEARAVNSRWALQSALPMLPEVAGAAVDALAERGGETPDNDDDDDDDDDGDDGDDGRREHDESEMCDACGSAPGYCDETCSRRYDDAGPG